jgi:hypothetical protein
MARKPKLRRTLKAPRRSSASEVPAVPTFESSPKTKQDNPQPVPSEQDAEEAVRRMVEAAYT